MQAVMQTPTTTTSALENWAADQSSLRCDNRPSSADFASAHLPESSASPSQFEHALNLSSTSASPSGVAIPANTPRFDFRASSQASPFRTSFGSYGNATADEALDTVRRSYSATSDIRGTLEDTHLSTPSEEWPHPGVAPSPFFPGSRRESEPSNYPARYCEAPAHRSSLPSSLSYPLERADSLPIRRLRRPPQPVSPGYSTAPSLTEGSTSPSTSRGSFVETPYLGPSPLVEDVATDPRFHGFLPRDQPNGGYPFPDMYRRPASRHSIAGPYYPHAVASHPVEVNGHGKRPSISHEIENERPYSPRPSSSSAFGEFSLRSTGLPLPPPYSQHSLSSSLPDPPKSAYDYRPASAHATSPRGSVYDVEGARQVFLPFLPQQQHQQAFYSHEQPPQHDLLPPHDGYEAMKKRRMSTAGSGRLSPSLSSRREAASALHLYGLPPPPAHASLPQHYEQHQHQQPPAYQQQHFPGAAPSYEQQPRTPTSASSIIRSGSYGLSFTSPAFLDNAPPLLLDSPLGSPRKNGAVAPVSPPLEPPCDELPQPPVSSGGGTAFMDPNYPVDNFSICHRRPPQADFEVETKLLPRTQDLRFEEDQYTPLWVRQDGKDKEGWCALCPGDGKWLQLKNSAFWYHRQFQHGISSSSGHYFLPPLETRPAADGGKTEGLCHMCGEWKAYQNHKGSSNSSGKGPTPWFRHAHECHQYFSPKKEARKNMKLARV
ncbi:hypothetical protein JCM1841_001550 [Sporobolomyces salmonicolor]